VAGDQGFQTDAVEMLAIFSPDRHFDPVFGVGANEAQFGLGDLDVSAFLGEQGY
jgi:hypothetical protein